VKKVAIFEPYVFDEAYGNLRYISGLFKYLDRTSFEPLLFAPRETEFFRKIEALGGRCICVPAPPLLATHGGQLPRAGVWTKLAAIGSLVRYNIEISRELKRQRVDILACNSIRAVMMAGWGGWLSGCPLVWYIKGDLFSPVLDRLGFCLARRILFQSAANMPARYSRLLRRYNAKVAVIENGVDLDEIAEVLRGTPSQLYHELGLSPDRVSFAYLGQTSPHKGLMYLLEAMRLVQNQAPVALYIVGHHGAEEYRYHIDELKSFVDRQGLRDIHFLGWRDDRLEILSLMDGFVTPSPSEGAPRSIMEAAALGKPVIATRVGSIPAMVEDGVSGFLVEPRNAQQLAQCILKMATDPQLRTRMGQRGFQVVRERHSFARNVTALQELYGGLAV
jgi:glycosyltransferase involved in cell wall biosynthesis